MKNLLDSARPIYIATYIKDLPLETQVGIVYAAKTASLAPFGDPSRQQTSAKPPVAGLPTVSSRLHAALAFVQKFRTFASRFSFAPCTSQMHQDLETQFYKASLDPFLQADPDLASALAFVLKAPCPVSCHSFQRVSGRSEALKKTIRAVKRLRAAVNLTEKQVCSGCPHRSLCPFSSMSLKALPNFRYAVRVLCGMHSTCLSYISGALSVFPYNPHEMEKYLVLVGRLQLAAEQVVGQQKPSAKTLSHSATRVMSAVMAAELRLLHKEKKTRSATALNIPGWMAPTLQPASLAPLTRYQRKIVRALEKARRAEATPEGYVDDETGQLVIKPEAEWTNAPDPTERDGESTYFASMRPPRKMTKRDLRAARWATKAERRSASFVWVPDRDPSVGDFGEHASQELATVSLEPTQARREAVADASTHTVDDGRLIVDLDTTECTPVEPRKSRAPSAAGAAAPVSSRFVYHHTLDKTEDPSVPMQAFQQRLYDNYLKFIHAPRDVPEPRIPKTAVSGTRGSDTTEAPNVTGICKLLRDPTEDQLLAVAEATVEIGSPMDSGYINLTEPATRAGLQTVPGFCMASQAIAKAAQVALAEATGSVASERYSKHIRKYLGHLWDNSGEIPLRRNMALDYPNQSSANVRPPLALPAHSYYRSAQRHERVDGTGAKTLEHPAPEGLSKPPTGWNRHPSSDARADASPIPSNKVPSPALRPFQFRTAERRSEIWEKNEYIPLDPSQLTAETLDPRASFAPVQRLQRGAKRSSTAIPPSPSVAEGVLRPSNKPRAALSKRPNENITPRQHSKPAVGAKRERCSLDMDSANFSGPTPPFTHPLMQPYAPLTALKAKPSARSDALGSYRSTPAQAVESQRSGINQNATTVPPSGNHPSWDQVLEFLQ